MPNSAVCIHIHVLAAHYLGKLLKIFYLIFVARTILEWNWTETIARDRTIYYFQREREGEKRERERAIGLGWGCRMGLSDGVLGWGSRMGFSDGVVTRSFLLETDCPVSGQLFRSNSSPKWVTPVWKGEDENSSHYPFPFIFISLFQFIQSLFNQSTINNKSA